MISDPYIHGFGQERWIPAVSWLVLFHVKVKKYTT